MQATGNYYSQFGEDRHLDRIFGSKNVGLCIEVGANNGVDDSTTYYFEKTGWECILIEPNPALVDILRTVRTGHIFECAVSDAPGIAQLNIVGGAARSHGMSSMSDSVEFRNSIEKLGFHTDAVSVNVRTLDSILEEALAQPKIDFISIDVEGLELKVLKGLSLDRWHPRIILLEDNSYFRDNEVANYLEQFGYHRFRRTGVNDWFAHLDDRELVNPFTRFQFLLTKNYIQFKQWIKQRSLYKFLHSTT